MKAKDALVAWTPDTPAFAGMATRGMVRVGPLVGEDEGDWTWNFACTGGAAFTDRRKLTGWRAVAMMMIEFHTLVVGGYIDPQVAHEAFLAIDEYRRRIAPDIPGAD